jgi:hypothetical protein
MTPHTANYENYIVWCDAIGIPEKDCEEILALDHENAAKIFGMDNATHFLATLEKWQNVSVRLADAPEAETRVFRTTVWLSVLALQEGKKEL